ncbi:MAG: hypothetical protein SFZ23_01195 [Planctomycetota bacterium]|nr:hypothetical protein [Planctomycetota bacterium]
MSVFGVRPALAWDAPGHRTITLLALDSLAEQADAPFWVTDESTRTGIADQSVMPDRWRSTRIAQLAHENNTDHFIDLEDLEPFGLTLTDISPLRYEFIKQMVRAQERAGAAFKGKAVDPEKDWAKTLEWPGFLPHAIMEHFAKLQSSFKTLRIFEALLAEEVTALEAAKAGAAAGTSDGAKATNVLAEAAVRTRNDQILMARANVMYHMGVLSHFVGDAAQPLHTTKHYNGWVGDNPSGFTTEKTFHAYIDGGIVEKHRLNHLNLRGARAPMQPLIDVKDPWQDVLALITRSFEMVTPLYEMHRTGELEQVIGARFIGQRMTDGAAVLGSLYHAAWTNSAITDKDVAEFKKYDGK